MCMHQDSNRGRKLLILHNWRNNFWYRFRNQYYRDQLLYIPLYPHKIFCKDSNSLLQSFGGVDLSQYRNRCINGSIVHQLPSKYIFRKHSYSICNSRISIDRLHNKNTGLRYIPHEAIMVPFSLHTSAPGQSASELQNGTRNRAIAYRNNSYKVGIYVF